MVSIEIECVTVLVLLFLVIILFSTVVWFVAKRKYTDYIKYATVEEIQKSIDLMNKINYEEKEEIIKKCNLESEINLLRNKVCFLSKYNCLNTSCPNRITDRCIAVCDSTIIEDLEEKAKELDNK